MILSIKELINKFPSLKKFENQKWIVDNAINQIISDKEIPLHCTLLLIQDLINYLEKTKFNSNWESFYGTKTRLKQIESLLLYFCEDSQNEAAKKGTDV